MNEGDAEQRAPLARGAAGDRPRPRSASACSAVRVITAFKRGFRRSIRARKCRVSSTLEICLLAKAVGKLADGKVVQHRRQE